MHGTYMKKMTKISCA